MNNIKKTALILEGGGFRGIYSAGILDYFLENKIEFPYVVGVSMGACNGSCYISKQIGRNLEVPYTFINDSRYISYIRLLQKGEIFGINFIFHEIPAKYIPFDFETFKKSRQKFLTVVTDCETGKAEYFQDYDDVSLMDALGASISLPFASKMIKIKERKFLDGGIADSIPFEKAFSDGYKKAVVILTQPKGYLKKDVKFKSAIRFFYRKHPALAEAIIKRSEKYNNSLNKLEQLEAENKVLIIRPESKLPIGRVEKNQQTLKETFEIGYKQCPGIIDKILKFAE